MNDKQFTILKSRQVGKSYMNSLNIFMNGKVSL